MLLKGLTLQVICHVRINCVQCVLYTFFFSFHKNSLPDSWLHVYEAFYQPSICMFSFSQAETKTGKFTSNDWWLSSSVLLLNIHSSFFHAMLDSEKRKKKSDLLNIRSWTWVEFEVWRWNMFCFIWITSLPITLDLLFLYWCQWDGLWRVVVLLTSLMRRFSHRE